MNQLLRTVKCLKFYPVVSWLISLLQFAQMLAEDMTPLGQRWRTLSLPVRAVVRVSAFSYTHSLSPTSHRATWRRTGDTCKSSGLCYKKGSLRSGHPDLLCWMVSLSALCPAGRHSIFEGHKQTCPLLQREILSIFQDCLRNKHPWKDRPKQRQSWPLLI